VTEQVSDGDKEKPNQGQSPSAFSSEGQVQENKAISSEGDPWNANGKSDKHINPIWVRQNLRRFWELLKRSEHTNVITAVSTFVIMLATCVTTWAVLSGSKQTNQIVTAAQNIQSALDTQNQQSQSALHETLRGNRRALRRNLAQSQEAMDASNAQSKAALDASIAASKLDQRAWVVVKGVDGIPQLDQPWELHIVFTNTGRTPAKDVRMSCNTENRQKLSDFLFKKAPLGNQPTLIVPNQEPFCTLTLTTPVTPKITQDILNRLTAKTLIVSVFGTATYDDIFGHRHWLTFCRIMHPDGKAWDDCEKGNDTGDGKPPN